MKKNYIFLIDAFTPGGAQRNLELILPELIDLGCNVHIVFIQNSILELDTKIFQLRGIAIHRLGAKNMFDMKAFYQLLNIIKSLDNRVVIANLYWSQIWSGLIQILICSETLIWVEHNTYTRRTHIQWMVYKCISKYTDQVFCVSSEVVAFLQKKKIANLRKINNAAYPPRQKSLNRNSSPVFLFVGRLVAQKNPLLALKSFEVAYKKHLIPEDSVLNLVGEGPLRHELETYSRETNLEKHVNFLGFLAHYEVINLMATSHVLVMSSEHEGSPLVRLEAITNGMCVVTTRTSGLDIFQDFENENNYINGLFVISSDINKLAFALSKALLPEYWIEPNIKIRFDIFEKFSPQVIARQYLV